MDSAADSAVNDDEFRREVRAWLAANVTPELRGLGGPGREHEGFDARLDFAHRLADAGLSCLGWPVEHGGRGAPLSQQVIFYSECAEADAPARVGYLGEELLGPTLIAHGTPEQQRRFLPGIRTATELWCQGYSEPGAGSDLAAVATRGVLDGGEWIIDGQKIWTSLAHVADWCFAIVRTGGPGHGGLSYLLVPMHQDGVTVRPIVQLTGTSEFNEVFFDGARTSSDLVVGGVGNGWRVAMSTLGFERGAATLGVQVGFRRELDKVRDLARDSRDPLLRDRIARAYVGLDVLRAHTVRTLATPSGRADASVIKLMWARWHRELGEIAMEARGAVGLVAGAGYDLDEWQRLFLFSRADTIYGGSDEIQRGIVAERALGLPRQARP